MSRARATPDGRLAAVVEQPPSRHPSFHTISRNPPPALGVTHPSGCCALDGHAPGSNSVSFCIVNNTTTPQCPPQQPRLQAAPSFGHQLRIGRHSADTVGSLFEPVLTVVRTRSRVNINWETATNEDIFRYRARRKSHCPEPGYWKQGAGFELIIKSCRREGKGRRPEAPP